MPVPQSIRFGDHRVPQHLWNRVRLDDSGCWTWTGTLNRFGYGSLRFQKRTMGAHRVFYISLVGRYDAENLDHLCRNRACVRPDHLEPVSHRENLLRGRTIIARNATATHCVHGHPFSGENLYVRKDGRRQCKACKRAAVAKNAIFRVRVNPQGSHASEAHGAPGDHGGGPGREG